MTVALQFKIKNDSNLSRYLKENSHWIKYLNRDPFAISQMEEEMKERYQLTMKDRLQKIQEQIRMVRSLMDILQ